MKKLLVAFALILPMVANAQFRDGNQIYKDALAYERTESGTASDRDYYGTQFFMGYVASFLDSDLYSYCLPPTATIGQASSIAVKYLKNHPEVRHMPATALLAEAFLQAFPCAPKPRPQPSKQK